MRKQNPEYEHDPLTYAIIGAAIEVHEELGPVLLEQVYENCLCIEFGRRNIRFEQQKRVPVRYKGESAGDLYVDLLVENRVVVELKSVKDFAPIHEAQLLTYLQLAQIKTGLLINFNVEQLKQGVRRYSL